MPYAPYHAHLALASSGVLDEAASAMELFGLLFFLVTCVLVGVGFAIGLFACVLAAIFVALGTVSSSVVVGILSRSSSNGIRTFLLQCGILAGIPAGAICAWLAHTFWRAYGESLIVLGVGAVAGALAGIILALMVDFILRRAGTWASTRAQSIGFGSQALPGQRRRAPFSSRTDAEHVR